MTGQRKIAVAMSGGVDSSVAAALLKDEGAPMLGIMMRLWSASPNRANRCCSPEDMAIARSVADQIGIPFHVLDLRTRFKNEVVDFFIDGYAQGLTPNPCMQCNRVIRWQVLLDYALSLGATHLATGHYARLSQDRSGFRLHRARDRRKDQSYVLSMLGQQQLSRALFPLGDLTKAEVRQLGMELGLPSAARPESQDLCFLGESDYREFLQQVGGVRSEPGPIVDAAGRQLGQHQGLYAYTIGQRKGIGIAATTPLYVLEKHIGQNALVVGHRSGLGIESFELERASWIAGVPPPSKEDLQVQVRYQSAPADCQVEIGATDGAAQVTLASPLPDVTPGQAAVFYRKDECLGGGVIAA